MPEFQRRRREIVDSYNRAFQGVPELETPTERADVEPALHIYALRLKLERLSIGRDAFIDRLNRHKVGASVHFIPNHLQPYYRDKYGYVPGDFPVAYSNYLRLVSLPLHPKLSNSDVERVIGAVMDVVNEGRASCAGAE